MATPTFAAGKDVTRVVGAFDASRDVRRKPAQSTSSNSTIELRVFDDAGMRGSALSSAQTVNFKCVTGGVVGGVGSGARQNGVPHRTVQQNKSQRQAAHSPKHCRKPSDAEQALMSLDDEVTVSNSLALSCKVSSGAHTDGVHAGSVRNAHKSGSRAGLAGAPRPAGSVRNAHKSGSRVDSAGAAPHPAGSAHNSHKSGNLATNEQTSDAIEALKFAEELFAKDTLEMDIEDGRSCVKPAKAAAFAKAAKSAEAARSGAKAGNDGDNAALRYLRSKQDADASGGKHSKHSKHKKNAKSEKHSKRGKHARRGNDDFDMFISITEERDAQDEDAAHTDSARDESNDASREEGSAAAARYTNRKKKSRRQKRKEERERQAAIEASKKPLFEPMGSASSRSGRKASGKANKSQRQLVHSFSGSKVPSAKESAAKRAARSVRLKAVAAAAIVALAAGVILYPAAREYYVSVRDLDKANVQLAQLEERNAQLQNNIDALSTDDGIENYVRAQYGWVKDGEEAVSVIGLANNSGTPTLSTASGASSQAKESPLTSFLDAVFFVN